jgi:quercetin dioxygenase-like cupin family protein
MELEMLHLKDTIFVPAGAGEQLKILGSTHFTKVSPEETGGAFTALEIVIPPECGPPMHSHETDSEFFYILEGELTLSDPDGDITARPGDFCFLRKGGHHAFRNASGANVRALVVVSPGVEAHAFFKQIDAELDGAIDEPVVAAIAGRNGIAF